MKEYRKIRTVFLHDPETKFETLLWGQFGLPEFEYLQRNQWTFTEKVNGINIRIMYQGGKITFGGKTDKAEIPVQLANRLSDVFLPMTGRFSEVFLSTVLNDVEVCLYCEGYGAKIRKGGGNYRPDQDVVLFDIKIGEWWLRRDDIEDIGRKLDLDVIPVIGEGTLWDMVHKAESGFDSQWGNFLAEGIVARPQTELRSRNGSRIITKIKHKDFLKKEGESCHQDRDTAS